MKEFITFHPFLAMVIAAIPIPVVIAVIWRCKTKWRVLAATLGIVWCVVATACLCCIMADAGEWLGRKNFVYLPMEKILFDVSWTAERENAQLTQAKLDIVISNWWDICQTQKDPWPIVDEVRDTQLETNTSTEANKDLQLTN